MEVFVLREAILDRLYGLYVDEAMSEKANNAFDAITNHVETITGSEEEAETVGGLLVLFMHEVFLDSTNLLLDFISGKEVQHG